MGIVVDVKHRAVEGDAAMEDIAQSLCFRFVVHVCLELRVTCIARFSPTEIDP